LKALGIGVKAELPEPELVPLRERLISGGEP